MAKKTLELDQDIKCDIAQTLSELRGGLGYTQSTIGKVLKVSSSQYSLWERGRGVPDLSHLMCFCDFIGISVAEFFKKAGY